MLCEFFCNSSHSFPFFSLLLSLLVELFLDLSSSNLTNRFYLSAVEFSRCQKCGNYTVSNSNVEIFVVEQIDYTELWDLSISVEVLFVPNIIKLKEDLKTCAESRLFLSEYGACQC